MKATIKTDLKNFRYKLQKFADTNGLVEKVTKRLGDEYLTKVVELTPVGDYSDRYPPYNKREGGNLRKAWKADPVVKTQRGAEVRVFNPLQVKGKGGKKYNLGNLVNDGHRQHVGQYIPPLRKYAKQPFVQGQHFVERANREFVDAMYDFIDDELTKQLKKALKK